MVAGELRPSTRIDMEYRRMVSSYCCAEDCCNLDGKAYPAIQLVQQRIKRREQQRDLP